MTSRPHVGIAAPVDLAGSAHARLRPLPLSAVRLETGFWQERCRRNEEVSLPCQWEQLESSGVLDNFRRVLGETDAPHRGFVFADTDLYKWIEAACWVLCRRRDEAIERRLDLALGLIERAQEPDGYLHTYYARERAGERFTNLRDQHELYSAGHLIQAAVAHRRATGSDRLLLVARRFADLVGRTFGPAESGRRPAIDGHEEVEMALIELARETGDRRYLEQARFFLEARGHGLLEGGTLGREYFQDQVPFREQEALAGHAVRALYYACGVTDLYLELGDASLLEALSRLFERMVTRQIYISGGLGARHEGEAFGKDFELPNARAYTETCAAIGSVMWCHRMLAATGEARYAELLETTLYNALLPCLSLDGNLYFYVNPLQDDGGHRRLPWYRCACCPPNVARTLASLPAYLYGAAQDAVAVHLYASSTARLELAGSTIELVQRTGYPWEGRVELEVNGSGTFGLLLRIPSWCAAGSVQLIVNGAPAGVEALPGSYAELRRCWRRGDKVELLMDLPVRVLESHPHVLENAGRVALARGPLLYCVEAADHPSTDLRDLGLFLGGPIVAAWEEKTLGGAVVLRAQGEERAPGDKWAASLYRDLRNASPARTAHAAVTAIPYFAWGNRAAGPMQVWLQRVLREPKSESST